MLAMYSKALRTLTLLTLITPLAFSQTSAAPVDPKTIPVIDAEIGPCSADFTVTDAAGVPVYDAKVRLHIAYGFINVHRLNLEVGTNADGKARFTGLPSRIKHGLFFEASQADRAGNAFDDPSTTCKAQFTITLQKKN